MAVVGLVLLIACANVAGMSLARSAARRREIAVRLALGARRRRIVRQLMTESVMLFLVGGTAGVLLAAWLTDLLLSFMPPTPFPVELDTGLDMRVLAFTFAVSLLTGLAFGLAPALHASKPDVLPALKDEAGGTHRRTRLLNAFVAGQIAVSLVLLVSTALFMRSMQKAREINPGFDAEGVQLAGLDLGMQGYDEEKGRAFYAQLLERLKASPEVGGVTAARMIPLDGGNMETGINVEGREPPPNRRSHMSDFNVVGPDYFSTLGVMLLRGRDFNARDVKESPRVGIVNESMARRFWPGEDPVGKRFFIGPLERGQAVEVVGLVRDGKYRTLGEDPTPYFYLAATQDYQGYMTLHVRPRRPDGAAGTLAAVRAEVAALDPHLPLLDVMPMTQAMGISLLPIKLAATVAGALGAVGLLLAAVGIFGVVSFSVAQRTREIGIRMALGAQGRDVLRLVIARGMRLALYGVAAGLAASLALTRVLAGLLYGISATDLATFVGVPALLLLVALLASYIPARRATKIDPMEALRYE
jgi:predicted permease